MQTRVINPWTWQDARGYAQAVEVTNATGTLHVSGQTATDADGKSSTANMRTQLVQTLQNLEQVVTESGYECRNIVRLNIYTTASEELVQSLDLLGAWVTKHGIKQASTLLEVQSLFETLTVELEATVVR